MVSKCALLFLSLTVLFVVAVVGQSNCFGACQAIDTTVTSYCSEFVDYTTCLPQGVTQASADDQARSNAEQLERFGGGGDCDDAQARFMCALNFPKCSNTTGQFTFVGTCHSTCVNYLKSCKVKPQGGRDQACTNAGYSGEGPSDSCTGDASTLSLGSAVVMVVLAAVAMVA